MKTQEHRNPQALIGSSRPLTTLTLLAGLLFGLAVSGLAADRNDLDQRIRKLTDKFEAMQANPGKRISHKLLQQSGPGTVEQNDALCLLKEFVCDALTRISLHGFELIGQFADSLVQIIPVRSQSRHRQTE